MAEEGPSSELPVAVTPATFHISCASDLYQEGKDYAGIVLYSHNGQSKWFLNGRKCQSGYVVVQSTSPSSEEALFTEGGTSSASEVVYRNVFNEGISSTTVGAGFVIRHDGRIEWNASAFQRRPQDERLEGYIRVILQDWMEAGRNETGPCLGCRNYPVESLEGPSSELPVAVTPATFHISCASDLYQEGKDYTGIVLYSHNGQSKWFLNGRKCQSGYVVVQSTSPSSEEALFTEGGTSSASEVVYRNVFDEGISSTTVGAGFVIRHDGRIEWNASAFKRRPQDERLEGYIRVILQDWMEAGRNETGPCLGCRNYPVESLAFTD